MLAPAGEEGLTLREMVARFPETEGLPDVRAVGAAGTVYLCHPFLVHAAQPHRGARPRFLALRHCCRASRPALPATTPPIHRSRSPSAAPSGMVHEAGTDACAAR
jgi:hypothetical protein